jgi:hypothetical protein
MDKDQLVDKMLDVCGYLSSYSDACKATVLDNFDLIYRYVWSILRWSYCWCLA